MELRTSSGETTRSVKRTGRLASPYDLISALLSALSEGHPSQKEQDLQSIFTELGSLGNLFEPPLRALSIAPIRTKPRRTYDQASEVYQPEGDHIPYVLARFLETASGPGASKGLREALISFGRESGLFESIKIKRLGAQIHDPFQVQVKIAGPPANLLDVGYGVSQCLPVIVQSALKSAENLLLLQQPEVHLHPKAQAALGSFLVEVARERAKTLVIETHSDFLIDRVRMAAASGRVSHENVSIIYFQKQGIETTVFPMDLDAQGNLCSPPAAYRSFFLQEDVKLLSRGGAQK